MVKVTREEFDAVVERVKVLEELVRREDEAVDPLDILEAIQRRRSRVGEAVKAV